MQGYPRIISTRQDMVNLLSIQEYRDRGLAQLQTLLDEQYGYDAAGAWTLVGGGGLDRLGISRAEAVAMGAVDRPVEEPAFDLDAYKAQEAQRLEMERDRRLYATFTDSNGVTWIVDDRGRKMLSDRLLLVMGGMSPASWEWTAANGAGVTMTAESLKTLCTELAAWHDAHFTACRVATGAVAVATTRGEVDTAFESVVWPAS